MAKATLKFTTVEVRQVVGSASITIMNDLKGELHARKGDWLIGNEKGQIEVLSDAEFKAKYELESDLTQGDYVGNTKLPDPNIVAPSGPQTLASAPVPGIVDNSKVPLKQ